MRLAQSSCRVKYAMWVISLTGAFFFSGCGMPGAPQPPSLNLPDRAADLSAVRNGNQVSLSWTMPKRNTDKLLLKDNIPARICRNAASANGCVPAGDAEFAPGADATYTDNLPAALASGEPRVLTYCVELDNRKGRSAGRSNDAEVLAGQAPPAVTGLTAAMARNGVLLRWTPGAESLPVRFDRRLLTPPQKPGKQQGPLAPPSEPVERTLLVETGVQEGVRQGRALDEDIRFGESYEYRAQRVARVTVDGRVLELDGPLSAPARIDVAQLLPPAVPTGLAAVASAAENGAPAAIDLSWTPDADTDLAGYIVYRREGDSPWQRTSPAQPVVGPGFHDADVQPGHTYHYSVSSIDEEGHQSARSAEAQETVPEP
jgi:hypothetical protein